MKTIEERAFADPIYIGNLTPFDAYIEGAKVQQQIDMDIFEDFIHDNFGTGDMEWYNAKGSTILTKMLKGE